jgi:hypothetical protein
MNDLETRLRELLMSEASGAPAPAGAPDALRRTRRRQFAVGTAAALAVASVAALALAAIAVVPSRDRGQPLSVDEGARRTVHVPYMTITYEEPRVLMLWDQSVVPSAVVQLTDFEPTVLSEPVCTVRNPTVPKDGVVLVIHARPGGGPPGTYSWPPELQPLPDPEPIGGTNPGVAPCAGTDQYMAQGRVPDSEIWIWADAYVGPEASAGDRDALFETFDALVFDRPLSRIHVDAGHGAVVLSSGEIDGTPWLLTAAPPTDQPGIPLQLDLGEGPDGEQGGLRGTGFGGVVVRTVEDTWINPSVMAGNTMLFGAVHPDIARVEIRPDGADPFDAHLVQPPASLGATFEVFAAPMRGAPRGTIVTYDAAGGVIREIAFSPDRATWPELEQRERPEGAVAAGTLVGTDWELVDGGDALYLQGRTDAGDASVFATAARVPDGAISFAAHTFANDAGRTASIIFGVAAQDVTQVVLFTSGLPGTVQLETLADGTQVYWQAFEPGGMKGQVIALDAACEVLQALDLATGEPVAEPEPTSCG